jgi:hypothetical protein
MTASDVGMPGLENFVVLLIVFLGTLAYVAARKAPVAKKEVVQMSKGGGE